MQSNRLASGGLIDRSMPLNFTFNRHSYVGYSGDTLASALLANGVQLVGRSFKLHRPRGIVAAGPEEPNAILQVGKGAATLPNLRATQVELYDGLEARSTKGWPGLRYDVAGVNDVFGNVFGAGFYYKTFLRPRLLWPAYEWLIRRSAGFGATPTLADPDRYEHLNAHCDVLVAGAGPTGLSAALAAARSGARVIVAEMNPGPGGGLVNSGEKIDGRPAREWIRSSVDELGALPNVTLLTRATVFGYHDHNFLTISELCERQSGRASGAVRERLWRVRARQVVLAQGAFERPLVFCNNDRPGVMLASAVSTYINRFAVCPGLRAVVFTNNDSAYRTALDLKRAGCGVTIIDSRRGGAADIRMRADEEDIPVLLRHLVTDVVGSDGVAGVSVAHWTGDAARTVESNIHIDCDLVAVSGGWSPAVHLHSQAGGKNAWDPRLPGFVPAESTQANISAGAANGKLTLAECLADGHAAGQAVAERCGFVPVGGQAPSADSPFENPVEALWRVPADLDPDRCPKQFVDLQNDTCVTDIRLAVREGYRNVEHVKRYTALGFGTDQGKLSNINGMAVLAECLGEPIENVGTTTFRPAYTPVTFGVCAGDGVGTLFDPVRKTALHEWHEARSAPMEVVGQWHRPWYFPQEGENLDAAVARECLAVRKSAGIMDASTLGKIDVQGPDAVEFLERMYTHDIARMQVGRCAYGILLGEDGMVMDDGVMARLGQHHFYLTTTTGGAARVLAWLERWLQTEWPDLEVYLTSVTDHYSTIAVAGPNSRRLLQKVGCDIDLGPNDFSFMRVREASVHGQPVQLFRVSFSGELAFEINLDSNFALDMWETLIDAGREFDLTPYGTETMHVLRAEKGFVIVGQDTDGSVTPVDLRMNWLLSKDKDFLGKRSLQRPDCLRADRKQFVGLLSEDGQTVLPEGTQLIADPGAAKPVPMIGHVTSSYRSACLGHPIALALMAGGHGRMGDTIHASITDSKAVPARVVSPVFYDPKNERQRD